MRTTRRNHAFTLVELLVAIGIIAVLIGILVPVVSRARESGNRLKCASNLRQIGQALRIYGQTYGELPRTNYHNGMGVAAGAKAPKAFSGYMSDDPFRGTAATNNAGSNGGRPADNDVTAALFLLVRLLDVQPGVFICPSTEDEPDPLGGEPALKRGNFSDRKHLSYSLALPYPTVENNSQSGYHWGMEMKGDLPVAADMNGGDGDGTPKASELTLDNTEEEQRNGNSPNHGRKGQNVLYFDGRVEFATSPFAGINKDNIYTRSLRPPAANQASDTADPFGSKPPNHVDDSLLLPTRTSTGISAF